MKVALEVAVAALGLAGMKLAGDHRPTGWALALASEAMFLPLLVMWGSWILAGVSLAYAGQYGANLLRWRSACLAVSA